MPTAIFEMPDGTRAKFDVPTGMSEDDMLREIAPLFDALGGGQEVEPQKTTSFGRTVLEQGLQGATLGFADEITSSDRDWETKGLFLATYHLLTFL